MNQANTDLTQSNITAPRRANSSSLRKRSSLLFQTRLCVLITLFTLVTSPSIAAGYDIWIYPLQLNKQTASWLLGAPKQVSNRDGYDNQPAFSADSQSLVFASDRGAEHNDIFRYYLDKNAATQIKQLTFTPDESEYSPQPLTYKLSGKESSATADGIRYIVEQGVPHQSVWQQEANKPRARAINSMIPTGYYAQHPEFGTLLWARYAYSLYFEASSLSDESISGADERHFVVANAGRSIHVIPNDKAFSYLHKQQDGDRVIKRFDPLSGSHTPLISVDNGSEDYAWSNNGWIFNIDKNHLRAWPSASASASAKSKADNPWQAVATLPQPSEQHVHASRIAISPDLQHIAIVWSRK
ncbi:hypothetical protein FM037_24090 [Shewanella psychropiezotolerans]|uniref:Uncharacterized protein n=1 Tax=Shewanella psychropiezotolerans TaxID=2593655 RepID=A0ABX5X5U2_9GAMM|nr:PD40 domain-containing protein [Shewanella psychropiezotolerans]QDO85777.1 hypothetical protein FM037_24090 [Shewanella psychropiezotolerans]